MELGGGRVYLLGLRVKLSLLWESLTVQLCGIVSSGDCEGDVRKYMKALC